MSAPLPLPIQALIIVRFHNRKGQEIVSIYPPTSHGLSEQQLADVRMLSMQEGIEPSPNQKSRFSFKIRNKKKQQGTDSTGSGDSKEKKRNSISADLFGYACFKRCRDTEGSARGFFHQSIVLITNVHKDVGLCTPVGSAYRDLFYSIVSRLDDIIADLPALEEAVAQLYGEQKRELGVLAPGPDTPAAAAAAAAAAAGGKWDDGDAQGISTGISSSTSSASTSDTLSPTAHSWGELHQTLEVAWMHFMQWAAAGFGEGEVGVMQALPFYGSILEFLLPLQEVDTRGVLLSTNSRPNAVIALARLGLLPHLWTLWELLMRGKDIVVYSPSAAVASSVIIALVELLLPQDTKGFIGYDIRPYISSCDSDVYDFLTLAKDDPRRYRSNSTTSTTSTSASMDASSASAEEMRKRPQPARIVGISNPFLLRAFERYDCALLVPNPDIGYATSSVFVGREQSSASAAAVGGRVTVAVSTSDKEAPAPPKRFSFSHAASGLTSLFSNTTATVAATVYADATVAFTPLGVGYMCSQTYFQDLRDSPEQCYDVNEEENKRVYRPVLGPVSSEGTPYAGIAAIPTLLKVIESAKSNTRSSPAFETAYDEWEARKANTMPICEKGDVRGTSGALYNHNRYSVPNSSSSSGGSSSKCYGLLVVRLPAGRAKNSALSILPESEVQTQLDAVLCSGNSNSGSVIAIADVLIRDHFWQLNAALLGPFALLRSTHVVDATQDKKADASELLRIYGLESQSLSDRESFAGIDSGSEAEDEDSSDEFVFLDGTHDVVDHRDLLIGSIAAFQRLSMPTGGQTGGSSWGKERDSHDAIYVPTCIRKIFFDASGSTGSSSSGGVCSPFMVDVSQTRFIYQWLRKKHAAKNYHKKRE